MSQNETIAAIARKHLGLDTLEARNSDSADFSEQGVWSIKAALEAAFAAGRQAVADTDADAALREMVAAFGTGSYGTKRQAAALKRARKITGQA